MDRLTKRAANGMPYLAKVKDGETAVEGSYNTLKCIQEAFESLAKYEETEERRCEGCVNLEKFENEVEYGANSPCTLCKRRCNDNYAT